MVAVFANITRSLSFITLGAILAVTSPRTFAGSYTNDFSSSVGNADLRGSAALDSGSVRLTENIGDQIGSLVIDDLDPGLVVREFNATFNVAIGPGSTTPADGVSFSFGDPPPETFGENGTGEGLAIGFDLFDNAGESPDAPEIRIFVNGSQVASADVNPFTGGAFVPVTVHYDAAGLDLTYNSGTVFTDLPLLLVPQAGDQFTYGARTGGSSAEQRVDDVSITTVAVPETGTMTLLLIGSAALLLRFALRMRA